MWMKTVPVASKSQESDPKGRQVAPKWAQVDPKWPQGRPKGRQVTPKWAQVDPNSPQRRTKVVPRDPQKWARTFKIDFKKSMRFILDHF